MYEYIYILIVIFLFAFCYVKLTRHVLRFLLRRYHVHTAVSIGRPENEQNYVIGIVESPVGILLRIIYLNSSLEIERVDEIV